MAVDLQTWPEHLGDDDVGHQLYLMCDGPQGDIAPSQQKALRLLQ
jgi:hypothetical protein